MGRACVCAHAHVHSNHPVWKQWAGAARRQSRCEATDKKIYLRKSKYSIKKARISIQFCLNLPRVAGSSTWRLRGINKSSLSSGLPPTWGAVLVATTEPRGLASLARPRSHWPINFLSVSLADGDDRAGAATFPAPLFWCQPQGLLFPPQLGLPSFALAPLVWLCCHRTLRAWSHLPSRTRLIAHSFPIPTDALITGLIYFLFKKTKKQNMVQSKMLYYKHYFIILFSKTYCRYSLRHQFFLCVHVSVSSCCLYLLTGQCNRTTVVKLVILP